MEGTTAGLWTPTCSAGAEPFGPGSPLPPEALLPGTGIALLPKLPWEQFKSFHYLSLHFMEVDMRVS